MPAEAFGGPTGVRLWPGRQGTILEADGGGVVLLGEVGRGDACQRLEVVRVEGQGLGEGPLGSCGVAHQGVTAAQVEKFIQDEVAALRFEPGDFRSNPPRERLDAVRQLYFG